MIQRINIKYAILALIAITAIGCTKAKEEEVVVNGDEIAVFASIQNNTAEEALTKGSVDRFQNTMVSFITKTTLVVSPYTVSYGEWRGVATTFGKVIFSPIQSYRINETYKMRGIYPQSSSFNATTGVARVNLTGVEDAMISDEINPGTIASKPSPLPYATFGHILSQFRFSINATHYPTNGAKLKKVIIRSKEAPLANYVDLGFDGSVTFGVNAANPTDMTVFDGDMAMPATLTEDVFYGMFEAGKDIEIEVHYFTGLVNKQATFDVDEISDTQGGTYTKPEAGKSYELVLNFTGTGITFKANLADWVMRYLTNENRNVW